MLLALSFTPPHWGNYKPPEPRDRRLEAARVDVHIFLSKNSSILAITLFWSLLG